MSETVKYLLDEQHLPRTWYNINADLPTPLDPVLHPGTQQPITADDLAVIQYLLSAGADLHAVDAYGNTALHYCSGQAWVSDGGPLWFALDDNPKVIELLRRHGIKLSKGRPSTSVMMSRAA